MGAEARADKLAAELAAANERTVGAEARGAAAEARVDKADARVDTLIAELAGANERAIAADARAYRLVADLNSLAVRMAEVLAHQLGEPGEPEPLPWWGRAWRRVVGG